jgi:hypothetical protein
MRRRTGAAGIAVAIAAIVPLADPAHPQERDSWTLTHQRAAQSVFDSHPGDQDPFVPDPFTPEPLSPDALSPDSLSPDALGDGLSGEGRPASAPLPSGRPDQGGFDEFGQGSPDGGRFDQDGTGQGGFDPGNPDDGRFDQGGNGFGGNGQGGNGFGGNGQGGNGFGGNGQGGNGFGGNGQGRIDAAREADRGTAGGASPRRDSLPRVSATSAPRPRTTAVPGPATSPAVTPTLGTQGGLGGASGTGPSGWDVGIGAGCVASAALATAYVLRRRRRA